MEATFVLPDDGPHRPVSDYVRRLTEAGYPCNEEPDGTLQVVVFDALGVATLTISVEGGAAVFVTLRWYFSDPIEAIETVGRVFAEAGWETEPDQSE